MDDTEPETNEAVYFFEERAWLLADTAQEYDYIMSHWTYPELFLAYLIRKPPPKNT